MITCDPCHQCHALHVEARSGHGCPSLILKAGPAARTILYGVGTEVDQCVSEHS